MNNELEYLRSELNQRLSFISEHPGKTVNVTIVIWSAVLIILAKDGVRFTVVSFENIFLYFIVATIFFISNLVLYHMALRYCNNIIDLNKLAAYIAVFYENRPSDKVKVDKNCCWELTTFEIMVRAGLKKTKYKRCFEYTVLSDISVGLIAFIMTPLFFSILAEGWLGQLAGWVVLGICLSYLVIPMCLISILHKNMPFKMELYGMKAQHMQEFINYALETKYYTEDDVKERFGKIYDLVKTESVVKEKGRKK